MWHHKNAMKNSSWHFHFLSNDLFKWKYYHLFGVCQRRCERELWALNMRFLWCSRRSERGRTPDGTTEQWENWKLCMRREADSDCLNVMAIVQSLSKSEIKLFGKQTTFVVSSFRLSRGAFSFYLAAGCVEILANRKFNKKTFPLSISFRLASLLCQKTLLFAKPIDNKHQVSLLNNTYRLIERFMSSSMNWGLHFDVVILFNDVFVSCKQEKLLKVFRDSPGTLRHWNVFLVVKSILSCNYYLHELSEFSHVFQHNTRWIIAFLVTLELPLASLITRKID